MISSRSVCRTDHQKSEHFRKIGASGSLGITLDNESFQDIKWWKLLLDSWNGKCLFLYQNEIAATELGLVTDASGSIGWGRTSPLRAGGSRADGQPRRQRNRFSTRSCLQSWQRVPHGTSLAPSPYSVPLR